MENDELRILMVEDESTDAELIQRELRGAGLTCIYKRVAAANDLRRELVEFQPRIVLLDFHMPGLDGMEALDIIRSIRPELPCLVVTGALGDELAVQLIHRGATDFILKSNLNRLEPAVRRALDECEERERRRKAEVALRRSEEQFRSLAENIRDIAYSTDAQGRVEYVNPHADRYGLSAGELIGQPFWKFADSRDEELLRETFQIQDPKGDLPAVEFRAHGADGFVHWVEDRRRALFDEEGRISGYTGIIRDITDRRQAERRIQRLNVELERRVKDRTSQLEALNAELTEEITVRRQAEEEREGLLKNLQRERERVEQMAHLSQQRAEEMEKVFTAMVEPVLIYDAQGTVINANFVAREMFGFDPIGMDRSMLINRLQFRHPNGGAITVEELCSTRALAGMSVLGQEKSFTNSHGASVTIMATASPLLSHGTIVGAVEVIHDITETKSLLDQLEKDIDRRKRLEKALRKSRDTLDAKVRKRTADLAKANDELKVENAERQRAETELRQSNELLERSERRFRGIFEQSFDFMWVLDVNGTVLDVNRVPLEFCHLEREEIIGKSFSIAPHWPAEARIRKGLRNAIQAARGGARVRFETVLLGPDGREAVLDFAVLPVFDEAGKAAMLIAEGRDISEQRRLEMRIQEIATEERAQVGRDLHDSLGQQLTGCSFLVRGLQKRLSDQFVPEAEQAARIATLLSNAIMQTRALARGLCPVSLTDDGLLTALEQLAWNVENIFGIGCSFKYDSRVSVRDAVIASNVYYIAQEAVNNAVRHSNAQKMRMRLTMAKGHLSLAIRDNGVGIPEVVEGKGMGLAVMKQRAKAIGAQLNVQNVPAGGTLVACLVPLDSP